MTRPAPPLAPPLARARRRPRAAHTLRRLGPLCALLVDLVGLVGLVGLLGAAAPARAATLPAGFTETTIGGLSSPTAMAFAPDGRLFVCQQGGSLRVIKNGALLSTPFLSVSVSSSGERGLLGLAFDPNFTTNNFIYVYYTAPTPAVHNRVSRFTANGDVAVAGSEVVLLDLNNLSNATNHNGGAMHFGPDGKLYIAVGENANSANAQTLGNLLGKMLRINPDPVNIIPTDNPFFSTATGTNRAIWALGLRNPFTFNFQPDTGRMFINDVGQNTYEEVNEGVAASNYGWPNCEGYVCGTPPANYRAPIHVYDHTGGSCAITGGVFYNPQTVQFPAAYVGKYFFADYCGGFIRYIDPTTPPPSNTFTSFATGVSLPVDLQVARDGSLWYLARGSNAVGRIQYPQGQVPPTIAEQPQSQTRAVGQSVTFNVSAAGSPPFSYQWQRDTSNIQGADGPSYTIAAVAAGDDGAQFRCIVSNAFNSVTSNSATLTVTTNTPPTPAIDAPAAGATYAAGATVNYAGTATDAEDGALPATAFTWSVVFHHDTHTHPFSPPTTGATSGSFVIPAVGETAANVWYRIHLSVTDAGGLTSETTRDIFPRTTTLTWQTAPAGLQITLDGQAHTDGYNELNVVNMQRTLGAPAQQTLGGVAYNFVSWSDGGARTHNLNVPASNTTYTANYARAASAGDLLISEFRFHGPAAPADPNQTGLQDEFVECYNATAGALTVTTSDDSAGWALASADGSVRFVIPVGTVIPAHGHYLVANPGAYSLNAYAGADGSSTGDIADNSGLALFNTATPANFTPGNRLDAVGFSGAQGPLAALAREGTPLPVVNLPPAADDQSSYVRRLASGTPQDTDDNAADFDLVCPCNTQSSGGRILGAPGPENLTSPTQRNAQLKALLVDPTQLSTDPPNRVRDPAATGANAQFGTLTIRRKFRNSTGAPVTQLRFRIVDITTLGTPNPGGAQADVRALTSTDVSVTVNGSPTLIRGTSVEQPGELRQPQGGGLNATLVVALPGGALANGAAVNVQFVLGVQTNGRFRFLVNVEAAP